MPSTSTNTNPFCTSREYIRPLQRELCQRIHYEALLFAASGYLPEVVPQTIDLPLLRQRARLLGREVYLQHPGTIDALFAGVSLGVYKLVEELYCSRFERSIPLVWSIIGAMAHQAGVADIPYEAVWALCMHLDEQRKLETEVTLQREDATWLITQIPFEPGGQHTPQERAAVFVCAIDLMREVVLAFRLADPAGMDDAWGLVIYDALVQQRRPSRDGAVGLAWYVPRAIVVEQDLMQDCRDGCSRLGIQIARMQEIPAFVQTLQRHWQQEISGRSIHPTRWTTLFDSYLYHVSGVSPLHTGEKLDRDYLHLTGYCRDPAWQCPALRLFLPLHTGTITQDGAVLSRGLHYRDDLLAYWPLEQVTFRHSEQEEARIWVYLHDSLLCQAMAQELRRRDGSYRLHQPER